MTEHPVRGTQSIVGQMGWVFVRPSLTALEVAWRWILGAPILIVAWVQVQTILGQFPPETTGLDSFDITSPWVSALKLAAAWETYRPHVLGVLSWLAPAGALAWIVVSGVGRNVVLKRMEPRIHFRPVASIVLQAAWAAFFALTGWGWWASIGWAADKHIGSGIEPDLLGYSVWAIFLTLGFFTLWALIGWVVAIAPMLLLLEDCSIVSALLQSVRLGKPFASKLVEVNLVMGIVKLALLVLAMVFSAVLVPFSDQVGVGALHIEWLIVSVFYFVASDYFHVVRLKGFIEFWRIYRGGGADSATNT
ncbi:MAG TPA: hypothetical protein VGJ21_04665 [Terracidiphilus sp.]|jgi:hypothetical protein